MRVRSLVSIVAGIVLFLLVYILLLFSSVGRGQVVKDLLMDVPVENGSVDVLYGLREFLAWDQTFQHHYSENYSCLEFSRDLMRNATGAGFSCSLVVLCYGNWSHAIVGFTVNGTMYFCEPQRQVLIDPYGSHPVSMTIFENENPYFCL